ncbi:MAG: DUF4097 family beta strand repeat-containing protein [Acidobacteriota bacterium]|jgi:DUF4097 and DUF4098 domain-containing protein YvlB
MQGRARNTLIIAAALLLAGTGAAWAVEVEETFDQTYSLSPGGEVSVTNVNGQVEVESWDRDEVRIEAVKKVKASSRERAEEALEETRIEIETTRDRIRVRTDLPSSSGGFLSWLFGNSANAQVSYRVTVPSRADVHVRTTNGKLQVRGVAGHVEASSTNGGIDIADIRGSVDASTTNGGVSVELAEVSPDRSMSFSSTNGGIRVIVPRDARISIDASTTNGGIRLSDLQADVRSKSRRKLRADVNGGGPEIDISTTNGGIRIEGGRIPNS